ncbi:hypothetical protein DFP72DRAFT_864912 [Ephemerocybe angulata]|uniref:Uncharacterized protein n=1 Tax=Ephemerocybe angulata TaxID=980116 RepID=A0A8H6H5I2_9AGAR|nr:hypothetical protein DFP72DRAFT_864912 [Tulosesus angulatus]
MSIYGQLRTFEVTSRRDSKIEVFGVIMGREENSPGEKVWMPKKRAWRRWVFEVHVNAKALAKRSRRTGPGWPIYGRVGDGGGGRRRSLGAPRIWGLRWEVHPGLWGNILGLRTSYRRKFELAVSVANGGLQSNLNQLNEARNELTACEEVNVEKAKMGMTRAKDWIGLVPPNLNGGEAGDMACIAKNCPQTLAQGPRGVLAQRLECCRYVKRSRVRFPWPTKLLFLHMLRAPVAKGSAG